MDRLLETAIASTRIKTGALTAHNTASPLPLVSGILGVLPRCLVVYQNAAAVARLAATVCVDRARFKYVLDASLSGICEDVTFSRGLKPRWKPALMDRSPDLDEAVKEAVQSTSDLWLRVLTSKEAELKAINISRTLMQEQLVPPVLLDGDLRQPSAQQLAPVALDLVLSMEGMMQVMQQHWRMFPSMACVQMISKKGSLFQAWCVLLILFGHS
ncbi:hypothetical protein V8C86DRAFT_3137400, partial [Haematococcus lacustris]